MSTNAMTDSTTTEQHTVHAMSGMQQDNGDGPDHIPGMAEDISDVPTQNPQYDPPKDVTPYNVHPTEQQLAELRQSASPVEVSPGANLTPILDPARFDERLGPDSKAKCSTPGCLRTRQYGPLCTTCRRREYEARRNNPDLPECIITGCNRPRGLARHQLCYPCYFEQHHQKNKDEPHVDSQVCSKPGCERLRSKGKTMCPVCHADSIRHNPRCSNDGCDRVRPATGRLTICSYCRNKAVRGRSCASQGCGKSAPKNGLGGIFCIDCALEHGMLVERQDVQPGTRLEQAYEPAPWWQKELERRRKKAPEAERPSFEAEAGVVTDHYRQDSRAEKRQKRVRNDAPCLACRQAKRKCEIPAGLEVCTRCSRQNIECRPYGEIHKVMNPAIDNHDGDAALGRQPGLEQNGVTTPDTEDVDMQGMRPDRYPQPPTLSTRDSSSGPGDDHESMDFSRTGEESEVETPDTSSSIHNNGALLAQGLLRNQKRGVDAKDGRGPRTSSLSSNDYACRGLEAAAKYLEAAGSTLEEVNAGEATSVDEAAELAAARRAEQARHEKHKLSFLINV